MRLSKKDYDAVVVGSGPNGLAAAITLQQTGLSVLLLEAKKTLGGGLRCAELTLPGFIHDVCSAVHPLAVSSPFFSTLPLNNFGLEYIFPPVAAAHPFDDGSAANLVQSIIKTAETLNGDADFYNSFMSELVKNWPQLKDFVLGPFTFPKHPVTAAKFGYCALSSSYQFAKKHLHNKQSRGFWAGMAAHSMQPLTNLATSGFALMLLLLAHLKGWPIIKGGSQKLADALAGYFISIGGKIEVNTEITSLQKLPSSHAILFDVTPSQLLKIAGYKLSSLYQHQLKKYRYGMGVFKIDWALDAPTPFRNNECKNAGTVHLGNTFEEITLSEKMIAEKKHPEKPFVLFVQPSLFDDTRAPAQKHTAWAYCHVPNGSLENMTDKIEQQVERFAPGFKERILAKHVMNANELEMYNANYIGGDINGGVQDISQIFTRPALRFSPYKTSAKGIYICSSSTPPGGGVHGMCGYHAARRALKDIFRINI
jgi:phytoene dehydrogenase-like protein